MWVRFKVELLEVQELKHIYGEPRRKTYYIKKRRERKSNNTERVEDNNIFLRKKANKCEKALSFKVVDTLIYRGSIGLPHMTHLSNVV